MAFVNVEPFSKGVMYAVGEVRAALDTSPPLPEGLDVPGSSFPNTVLFSPPAGPSDTTERIAILRDLANLSSADSPEFRDPGWEDQVRALIRRARIQQPDSREG